VMSKKELKSLVAGVEYGDTVRMSVAFKSYMRSNQCADHIAEVGDAAEGTVEDFDTSDPSNPRAYVRWAKSGIESWYDPADLEPVTPVEAPKADE